MNEANVWHEVDWCIRSELQERTNPGPLTANFVIYSAATCEKEIHFQVEVVPGQAHNYSSSLARRSTTLGDRVKIIRPSKLTNDHCFGLV